MTKAVACHSSYSATWAGTRVAFVRGFCTRLVEGKNAVMTNAINLAEQRLDADRIHDALETLREYTQKRAADPSINPARYENLREDGGVVARQLFREALESINRGAEARTASIELQTSAIAAMRAAAAPHQQRYEACLLKLKHSGHR